MKVVSIHQHRSDKSTARSFWLEWIMFPVGDIGNELHIKQLGFVRCSQFDDNPVKEIEGVYPIALSHSVPFTVSCESRAALQWNQRV